MFLLCGKQIFEKKGLGSPGIRGRPLVESGCGHPVPAGVDDGSGSLDFLPGAGRLQESPGPRSAEPPPRSAGRGPLYDLEENPRSVPQRQSWGQFRRGWCLFTAKTKALGPLFPNKESVRVSPSLRHFPEDLKCFLSLDEKHLFLGQFLWQMRSQRKIP